MRTCVKKSEVDELARQPERGGGIGEVLALDKPVADRRAGQPLVEPRQSLGRLRDRRDESVQGQKTDVVSHCFHAR